MCRVTTIDYIKGEHVVAALTVKVYYTLSVPKLERAKRTHWETYIAIYDEVLTAGNKTS